MYSSINEYEAKVVVLGNGSVGKTTLIDCFKRGQARDSQAVPFQQTQFPDQVIYKFQTSNALIKGSIWDTAGQEKYRTVNRTFYRMAKGALLVADLSIREPKLENDLEFWMKEFKDAAEPNAPIILVGNKNDLEEDQKTSLALTEFADLYQLPYHKTSARTGDNVDFVFKELLNLVNEKYFKDLNSDNKSIDKDKEKWNNSRDSMSIVSLRRNGNGGQNDLEGLKEKKRCCGTY